MHRIRWSSCLLGLGLAGMLLVAFASRAQAVTVRVLPADTTVVCGDKITVRAMTGAFSDLKAYQLIFRYNSTVLKYLGPIAGDVLTGSGQPYVMEDLPDVWLPPDTVGVDCAQLVGSTSGPGVLAYFRFEVLTTGTCPIQCLKVDFRDSFNNTTLPDCVGAIVRAPYCPTPTLSKTWGRIKTLYR